PVWKPTDRYLPEEDPLQRVAQAASPAHVFYYHCDHIGTPYMMMDELGDVVWEATYRAWGETQDVIARVSQAVGIAARNPIRFQGQQEDSETGLSYTRNRYYDSSSGRFISQDPLGVLGGINAYQYAPSPTQWIDPLGLRKRLGCKGKFHSFHDFDLPEDKLFASDAVQFRLANKTLIERMNTDPEYRRDMLGRNPALLDWMKDPDLSKSPPGMTWHHNDAPGLLNLVSFDDHRDGMDASLPRR
ncbi:RHS repeat-associated core domain-containing protein, partial [Trinickia soli]